MWNTSEKPALETNAFEAWIPKEQAGEPDLVLPMKGN
jgi:hypothetical protein